MTHIVVLPFSLNKTLGPHNIESYLCLTYGAAAGQITQG